jgi:hypothetical protein
MALIASARSGPHRVNGKALGYSRHGDRSKLSKDVLIGIRDLDRFSIKSDEERLTSPDGPRQ